MSIVQATQERVAYNFAVFESWTQACYHDRRCLDVAKSWKSSSRRSAEGQ